MRTPRFLLLTVPVAGPLVVGAALAAPADKAYTVANYPVEAEAANAVAAKDKALAEGQEAAFRSLLKRLVPVTAYKQLERLKALTAAEIVDGVRVRSEQNSTTKYIASLDFTFQADAVRGVLSREGIPYVEELAPEIVLVPVVREPAGAGQKSAVTYRSAEGPWAEVWKGLDLENTLAPARIAPLRKEIHPDTLGMLMSGEGGAERIFASEYSAERVVVAVAEVDLGAKRLEVTLAGWDAVGPIAWKRSYRIHDGDTAYAMEFASVVSLGVLEGRWKTLKRGGVAGAGGGEDVDLLVQFSGPEEWNDLRGRLLDLPGVDDVRVQAMSAGTASVAVRYPGGAGPLADALSREGISLVQSSGVWVMRSGY